MKKMTNKEIAAVVEEEGIGYAILYHMGPEHIQDPKLAKMWAEAEKQIKDIKEYLNIKSMM